MRQFGEVTLGTIELFCLCVQSGSFSAAAVKAGLTPPAVSRAIARLEQHLGAKLFARTTRRFSLTDAGQRYYHHCRLALAQLGEAERELAGEQQTPSGTVRISIPTPLGQLRVLPSLPLFQARYPEVQLEVQLSNRNVDFIADGFDLAIRVRTPPESELIARPLGIGTLVVVAAPGYLERCGIPESPADLAGHDCIQFLLPSSGQPVPWRFVQGGKEVEIATRGSISITDDLLGCVTLARHGAGLLQTYRFLVEDDLACGNLLEVLPGFAGAGRPMSLLYPRNTHLPLRTRVFIDFLMEQVAGSFN
ncbi:LysR family transcriptional regulator [Shewanella cyperi]|uniref:LysR family transcriptional regulator n=1 Tax=Shewanella cyperi TaxID=2814292 RepID=UPI001A95280A|nr:LysR family transcriptional regulator [Shewanella cyperi]QSX40013.1 LysR family transcriptional regulator [Shewanella cyperi]